MQSLLPIAPGLILEGRRERLGATWLAPGLIHKFAAFTASWPVKPGSRSLLRANLKSATWLAQAGSHFFSEWQLPILFSGGLAEISTQISLIWKECDLACASRVALWGLRLRGSPKCRKMKVLRMRCSIVPTPCDIIFKPFPASQLPYRAKSKN